MNNRNNKLAYTICLLLVHLWIAPAYCYLTASAMQKSRIRTNLDERFIRSETVLRDKQQQYDIGAATDNFGNIYDEIGPPPDLPSLLLANRIVYIGSPLVPSVTEAIVAQLLFLNHDNPRKQITLYINSQGSNSPDGRAWSFDNEAFAIADTMLFIDPPIRTICVGQACGTAAMLLALGNKGHRCALPHASIMLSQPKSRAKGQATDVALRAKEILNNRRIANEYMSKATGRDIHVIEKDSSRLCYFSPDDALQYGIIDKILYPEDEALPMVT